MNELLIRYVSVSFSAALLMTALMLLRPLYKNRFSKRWQYYIWLVVIIRLLIPWNPGNGLVGYYCHEIQGKIQSAIGQISERVNSAVDSSTEHTEEKDEIKNEIAVVAQEQPLPDQKETDSEKTNAMKIQDIPSENTKLAFFKNIANNIWIFWLVTALILFIRKITIYQSFVKFLKAGCVTVDEINRLEILGKVMEQNGLRCKTELYKNSLTASPLLIGFFHPAVVLTKTELSDIDFYYIALHELTHYRRRDMFYKWLVQFTIYLHWFNPFIYVLEREVSRLCELSCDEAVIKKLDADGRRAYGDTLLRAMREGGFYKNAFASITLLQGKELLKERLGAIMKEKRKTGWTVVFSAVAALLFAGSAVVAGAYVQPQAVPKVKSESKKEETSLSEYKMIEQNGNFYILYKGANEQDMPSGGVTDGCIGITLVKKEEYTAIGPFKDVPNLARDVKTQTEYLLEKKSISKEEAQLFGKAAEKIQKDILKIGINRTKVSLSEGTSIILKLFGTDKQVKWSSDNKKIATVNKDGKVTAKKAGEAVIKAKVYGQTYSCAVNVYAQAEKEKANQEEMRKDAYRQLGITKKNGAYYFRGRRIRIFMDMRKDQSFELFHYDKDGKVDIRLDHSDDYTEASIANLTESEAKEILRDMTDTDDVDDGGQMSFNISRLKKSQLSPKALEAVRKCKDHRWYEIADNDMRYIYYHGLPGQYAFEPKFSGQKAEIEIVDMKSYKGTYVLLAVRNHVPFIVKYQDREVALQKISI